MLRNYKWSRPWICMQRQRKAATNVTDYDALVIQIQRLESSLRLGYQYGTYRVVTMPGRGCVAFERCSSIVGCRNHRKYVQITSEHIPWIVCGFYWLQSMVNLIRKSKIRIRVMDGFIGWILHADGLARLQSRHGSSRPSLGNIFAMDSVFLFPVTFNDCHVTWSTGHFRYASQCVAHICQLRSTPCNRSWIQQVAPS